MEVMVEGKKERVIQLLSTVKIVKSYVGMKRKMQDRDE